MDLPVDVVAPRVRHTHGGSRKGQTLNISAYATKAKFELWSTLDWDERVKDIIRTMRLLGCEWPSEHAYKSSASVPMLWESLHSPHFDAVARFRWFKAAYNVSRQTEQFPDLMYLHGAEAHFKII